MIATVAPLEAAPSASPTTDQIVQKLQESVSATRLSLYLSCRLKFFFRYVAGLKKPKTPALHVGSTVHRVLKAWNKARWRRQQFALKELHDEFSKAWADDEEEPVAWDDDEVGEKATAWKLIETYVREANPSAPPEAVEVPVEADLHAHGLPTLIGVLDLVQAGIIVDYKTSGQAPNAERVAHTTEVQTSIYCVLYRHNTGRHEQGVELHHLVKLKTPKVVITALPPMSEPQHTRLLHLMEGYFHGLERRDFLPSPGLQCASCEFFNECRLWG
jgi:putative RecB family exonuclease